MTRPRPGVLSEADLDRVRAEFGVADSQVRRDHVISHVLGALAAMPAAKGLVFIGGTALARSLVPTLRLSEDIDLITYDPRPEMAERMQQAIERGLARAFGDVTWDPTIVATRHAEPAVLSVGDTVGIQIQLLSADGYPRWPTRAVALDQRYQDAPAATLTTPTAPAFAAAKAMAWHERHAPRDLYDLWALATHGHIDAEAGKLLRRHGPTSRPEPAQLFSRAPTLTEWSAALGHQCIVRTEPDEALDVVRAAWTTALAH
ncbi:MAG: nucleotidyl transferase AbiEii/AbiGii toxin family protein [Sporichthyaceae bacterium]